MAGFFRRRINKAKGTLSDWMGIGIFMNVFGLVKDIFIAIFIPSKKEKVTPETFEAAMKRMKLTEADIEEKRKMFLTQVYLYVATGLAVLGYAVWLAFQGYIVGTIIAILVSILSLAYAFRSHFWLFQIKQRRLGCTFKEYLDSSL